MTRRLALAVVIGAMAVHAVPVAAQDLEEDLDRVLAQAEQVSAEIASTSANRTALAQDIVGTEARLNDLLVGIGRTEMELSAVSVELEAQRGVLADVRNQLAVLHGELVRTQAELDQGQVEAVAWARQIYMSAGQDETYLALSAAHLSDISIGMEYLDRIASENARAILVYEALRRLEEEQAVRIAAREVVVEGEVAELDRLEAELVALSDRLAEQHRSVEAELTRQEANLVTLESEIEHFEGELASLEAEQVKIEKAIAAEQAGGGSDDGGGGETATSAWIRPVPGRITSGFGPRTHPILGYVRMHTGADFTAPYGQEIRAAQAGRVILAGRFGGYGNTVVIDHGGGVATLYAHQSELVVVYGDSVERGERIGLIGSTGLSTGPHLHFEVRVDGTPVDPVPYL